MAEPHTDPNTPNPVPLAVLATAAWHLRGEAHTAAAVCERLGKTARDAEVRELARALQPVLFHLANLGSAARRPTEMEGRPPLFRRILLALIG